MKRVRWSQIGVLSNVLTLLLAGSVTFAGVTVDDFEDLTEGFYGIPYTHQGITYHDLNNVSGVFPNGDTFGPQDNDEVVVEDATDWYNSFPGWGSADKTMTFGIACGIGDNLSLGRLSTVMMDLPSNGDSVSIDLGYLENGPWGGIEFHLDALINGQVVGTDSFMIADGGGRDNGAIHTLVVNGVEFDQLNIYATFGTEFSLPRAIIDDVSINYLSTSATLEINPDPLVAGKGASFTVTNATPNEMTYLAYSLKGEGSTFIPFLNISIDLAQPKQAGQPKVTDAHGAVKWGLTIPSNASGLNLWLQAAQFENKTNLIATRIQ